MPGALAPEPAAARHSPALLRARSAASSGGRAAEGCGEVSGRERLFALGVRGKQPLSQHCAGSCLPPAAFPPIAARCRLTLVPPRLPGHPQGRAAAAGRPAHPVPVAQPVPARSPAACWAGPGSPSPDGRGGPSLLCTAVVGRPGRPRGTQGVLHLRDFWG